MRHAYNVMLFILINNNVDFEQNKIIQFKYLFNYQYFVTILSFPVFNYDLWLNYKVQNSYSVLCIISPE